MKKLLNYARTEMQIDNNYIEKWDNIKGRIKRVSINFSKEERWKEKQEEQNIRKKLEEELILLDNQRSRDCGKYELYKNQLNIIERKKCKGAAIRCRFQNLVEGEKCTGFFLGLEKQKQKKTIIEELKDKDNNIHKDKIKILEIITEYYKNLYKKEGSDKRKTEEIIAYIDRKINKEDKMWCDSKLTINEIENAIKNLNKNKSPGSDGLTADFYMAFSEQMAPLLLDLYQAIQDNKRTPESLTKGIITLIYKNKGDRNNISNYRPISLLNTDYKILTKTLANRLKQTLNQVISTNQAYSIPNRDIQDSIHTIRDTVRGMKAQGGQLLTIDLEKAFDRVEHNFLFKVLGKMGYGEGFIEWVKLLYTDARSVIKCNGFLTDSFRIGRSVRQGCPLSALLYSIVTEPLAQAILQDKHILGINTPANRTVKITQYADDITITVKSGELYRQNIRPLQNIQCSIRSQN
uniref:Reverse transcriptase domain-containing protein n=1 Tax=Seriola dumerili TaxID=41447 RepID=A0A3B4URR0_SERDU